MFIKDGGGGTPISTTAGGVDMTAGMQAMMGIITGNIEIAIDMAQVAAVQAHLDQAETHLNEAKAKLQTIPSSAVGASPVGQLLAHHSTLADAALRDTLTSMEKGVALYRELIQKAVATMNDVDAGAGALARRGEGQILPSPSASGGA